MQVITLRQLLLWPCVHLVCLCQYWSYPATEAKIHYTLSLDHHHSMAKIFDDFPLRGGGGYDLFRSEYCGWWRFHQIYSDFFYSWSSYWCSCIFCLLAATQAAYHSIIRKVKSRRKSLKSFLFSLKRKKQSTRGNFPILSEVLKLHLAIIDLLLINCFYYYASDSWAEPCDDVNRKSWSKISSTWKVQNAHVFIIFNSSDPPMWPTPC